MGTIVLYHANLVTKYYWNTSQRRQLQEEEIMMCFCTFGEKGDNLKNISVNRVAIHSDLVSV